MAKNISKHTYLSIKEVSKQTGVSERTLKDRCQKHKYEYRFVESAGGKQGKKYEILVSSLETELQNKVLSLNFYTNNDAREALTAPPVVSLDYEVTIPESAKKLALSKVDKIGRAHV